MLTKTLYQKIWSHLSAKRKLQFYFLLALTILSTFLEVFSIGLLLPFLSLLTNSGDKINSAQAEFSILSYVVEKFEDEALLIITIVFILMTIAANSVRLLLMWVVTKFSTNIGSDFGVEIFNKTLHQPYQKIVEKNSSELISAITQKINSLTYNSILPMVNILTSTLVLIGILGTLLYINVRVTSFLFAFITVLYLTIFWFTKKRLIANSKKIADQSTHVIKVIQEGLSGIREIIVDGTQAIYCKAYKKTEDSLRGAVANNLILAVAPRYIVEGIGITIIATIGYILSTDGGHENSFAVPLLGVIALGAQRMLPALQQIYQSWAAIEGGKSSAFDAITLLDQPSLPDIKNQQEKVEFKKLIEFKNVGFSYSGKEKRTLKNINFKIFKGQHIGIVGKSGAGKSTLLDILIGLLTPSDGDIFIDEIKLNDHRKKSWQSKITHVSQNVFIADGSIIENIAFGVEREKVDFDLLQKCIEICQLSDLIESSTQKYETIIGERGGKISGGQRQRIGIARALYRSRDLIVFDEATSALDFATEKKILDAIIKEYKNITMIFISHRISTLENCSSIIELQEGEISRICDFKEIIE